MKTRIHAVLLLLVLLSAPVRADDIRLAVAANFLAPIRQLAPIFEAESGHRLVISAGSTGKLYAQIRNGAPFDVLLAADDETPARLEKEGLAVAGTRFTYAIGRLVLWSAQAGVADARGEVLRRASFRHLAIANPRTAPYGEATIEVLKKLGLHEALAPKFVQGENIAQTQQFVASGNAELGFIALSQVWKDKRIAEGSGWIVPAELHQPLRQDAVLLAAGSGRAGSSALLAFLRGEKARSVVRGFGYDLP